MAYKGQFIKYVHKNPRFNTSYPAWSFLLTNTSWFGKEQVKAFVTDYYHQRSKEYPFESRSGQTYTFNMDTIDWEWCQGDMFLLYDQQGRELGRWEFYLKEYAPGECPECHGSKKCSGCRGQAIMSVGTLLYGRDFFDCPQCSGTGVCQTCYIPYHWNKYKETVYVPPKAPKTNKTIGALQQDINKTNDQILRYKNGLWQLQLQGRKNTVQYKSMENNLQQLERELNILTQQLSDKMRQ